MSATPRPSGLAQDVPAADVPASGVVGMVVYEGFTALDFFGSYQFLRALPGRDLRVLARTKGLVTSDTGIQIHADTDFDSFEDQVEVLFIGGGTEGTLAFMQDPNSLAFIRRASQRARVISSVCTGSLILGAAGLLEGKKATSHWTAVDLLSLFGASPLHQRVVVDGRIFTGAGVSAGLDLGLHILAHLEGEEYAKQCQLFFEYDPQPPFDYGSPTRASRADVQALTEMVSPFLEGVKAFAKQQKK